MAIRQHLILALMLGAASTAAGAANASYSAAANATSNTRNANGPTQSPATNGATQPTGTLKAESSVSDSRGPPQYGLATGAGSSSATGSAGTAVLDLSAMAQGQLTNVPFSAPMAAGGTSSSSARFMDSFVVNCPDPVACAHGSLGSMTIAYVVQAKPGGSGYITPTGILYNGGFSGYAQWASSINLQAMYAGGFGPIPGIGSASWAGGQTVTDSLSGPTLGDYNISYPLSNPGTRLLSFTFAFGAPVFVDMLAMAGASAGVGYDSSGSSAESSFAVNPFRAGWGGIVAITGAGGAAISGASALSTGATFDYMNNQVSAVPEPESVLMLVAGLGLVLSVAQRRRRR